MSDFCLTLEEYANDARIECKYGEKCYQKNTNHISKYKHPPKKENENGITNTKETRKKRRLELEDDNNQEKKKRIVISSENEEMVKVKAKKNSFVSSSSTIPQKYSNDISDSDSNPESDSPKKLDLNKKHTFTENHEDIEKVKAYIKEKFLFEMPEDFYQFWDFCKTLTKNKKPEEAFKQVGLILVGPYDVLVGKFDKKAPNNEEDFLLHWRYFYDPPEFQTILRGDERTGLHIGYFRDNPQEKPVFLASNLGKKDGEINPMGENIFSAVNIYLENLSKSADPFKKMSISKVHPQLKKEAERLGLDMNKRTENMKMRVCKVVTKTFNTAGLVVPVEKKTQVGYRELAMKDAELKKALNNLLNCSEEQKTKYLSELQPVMTYASIAMDECDFGTGVELGLNLLASGVDMNSTIARYLTTAYKLLGRDEFAKIAEVHMNYRKKGTNLSII